MEGAAAYGRLWRPSQAQWSFFTSFLRRRQRTRRPRLYVEGTARFCCFLLHVSICLPRCCSCLTNHSRSANLQQIERKTSSFSLLCDVCLPLLALAPNSFRIVTAVKSVPRFHPAAMKITFLAIVAISSAAAREEKVGANPELASASKSTNFPGDAHLRGVLSAVDDLGAGREEGRFAESMKKTSCKVDGDDCLLGFQCCGGACKCSSAKKCLTHLLV